MEFLTVTPLCPTQTMSFSSSGCLIQAILHLSNQKIHFILFGTRLQRRNCLQKCGKEGIKVELIHKGGVLFQK